MRKRNKLLLILAGLLFALYLGSYLWLSRRGYAQADEWHAHGFYYLTPENSVAWERKNYACVTLFWPLNLVDRALGTGRDPAFPPLWGLSKAEDER